MRYSTLDQVNRENVSQLQVAWTYDTGDIERGLERTIECTPLVVDGVMYLTTASMRVVALDAATGKRIWEFVPPEHDGSLASGGVNRGVAYWSDGKDGQDGQRRILHGMADARLWSLDARTGKPDPNFGDGSFVDLRHGLDRDITGLSYGPTSAPAIWKDTVVLGVSCGEGPGPVAPGDVRAFDIRTGRQVWRFRTVPVPGEFGNERGS
jgi:quinoprotein glucose dehydrogenase